MTLDERTADVILSVAVAPVAAVEAVEIAGTRVVDVTD
jgi:hypothetical protein